MRFAKPLSAAAPLLAALATVALLALAAAPAHAAMAPGEVDQDCSLASSLVTPHKDWGKPLAGGPVRALFFIYTGAYDGTWEDAGTRVREAVELGERFDLRSDAVLYCGSGDKWAFHGQKAGEERAERLLAEPYDLYVIAGFPMGKLPAKIQYLILAQVAKGAGLVCCGPGADEYLTAKRQITPTPPALVDGLPTLDAKAASDMVKAYRLNKGRAAWLSYGTQSLTPTQEFSYAALADYDYWMLWVGRAAMWAAGREGEVEISFPGGGAPGSADAAQGADAARTIDWSDPSPKAEVALTDSGRAAMSAKVDFELCRADDGLRTPLGEQTATLAPGRTARLTVPLPRLRDGDYFLDAVVRDRRGIVASGAGNLRVASKVGVDKVEMARSFVERGGVIRGTVTLRGTPPAGAVLRVALRDSYGRVFQQTDTPVEAGRAEYPFTYQTDASSTILMRAQATLLAGGRSVEMKSASFTVPKRRHGQFNFVIWDMARGPLGYYAWRQLQQAGIRVCLIFSMGDKPTPQPAVLRAGDASLVPYSTRILANKDARGYMLPMCWNDDPAAAKYVQGIVDRQEKLREQGVFVYSLGDEGVTKGCCVSPEGLAAYRQWLAGQYGTIAALNASWGSHYSSFAQVDILNHKDNMETASARTDFPRWYDRQAFARYNLMHFSGRFVSDYLKLDPQAKTGFEGTGGFGDDYDAITGVNTFYGPYPSIGDDIVRSIYPRDRVRSNWMGYSKTGDALSDAAWRMVIKGMDSVWFWMWSGIGSWRGYLRPTLDFWPATRDLMKEMAPVRHGLGDLLLKSRMLDSGIAFYYSLPSALASELENAGGFIAAKQDHEAWAKMTWELGLDFRYVTSETLRRGALDAARYRVLVMPMAQAISPEDAAAIRRFAEEGGTVIADVRPGVYNGHCKPVLPGVLDDLFGIKRAGRAPVTKEPVAMEAALGGEKLDLALSKARVDGEVTAASAKALGAAGKTPLMLVHRVGAGRAILLNFQPEIATAKDADAALRLLRFLYAVGGAKSAVGFAAPDGGPMPETETRVWRTGDALVFGLLRRMENQWFSPKSGTTAGAPERVRVTLPSRRYVYDLRAHRALGKVSHFDTSLRWGRASYFAALRYPIPDLHVALSTKDPKPGQAFTADLSLDLPAGAKETFAAWVEVIDPHGGRPVWGRKAVVLDGGRAEVPLREAYNDLPGKWRVRATELFSNRSAEASWTVR